MNSNKTKVVITGASGFLGRNLVDYLEKSDKYVIYALSSQGNALQQHNKNKNVRYYDKDVVFTDRGKQILKNAIVVNCAFPRNSTGTGMADGLKYIQGVFLKAKERKAKAVINISSQSVYSATREVAATEETPVCLETTYAVGKYATELMLESILQGTNINYTSIRLASLIGPGFEQRIVNRFVRNALGNQCLQVKRNRQVFGFLDIEDAVIALSRVIENNSGWNKVYNLGVIGGYSLVKLSISVKNVIERLTENSIHVEISESDEFTNSTIDANKFYVDFEYVPSISIETSILKITKEQ